MQMIDVLKRLAELDSTNPTIVKENSNLEECGPMGMMGGMGQSHTPASISMTADSGEELSGMLGAIMKLAGIEKVEPSHLGIEPEPMSLTAEPVAAVGPAPSAGDEMRSVIDKMHDAGGEEDGDEGDEKETDESAMYDNSPADPNGANPFDAEEFVYHPNKGSTHGRATKNNPHGNPANHEQEKKNDMTMEQRLMAEYKQYVAEGAEFGAYYAEQLAQKVFDENPNLPTNGRGDEYFDAAWPHMVADLGKKAASYKLNYDEDFPSDTISAYSWLQKQHSQQSEPSHDMMEAKMCSGCDKPVKKCTCDN